MTQFLTQGSGVLVRGRSGVHCTVQLYSAVVLLLLDDDEEEDWMGRFQEEERKQEEEQDWLMRDNLRHLNKRKRNEVETSPQLRKRVRQ